MIANNPGRRLELIVEATTAPAPTTPMAQLNQLETIIAKTSPDVQPCSRARQSTIDGVSGMDVLLCYTDKTRTGTDRQRTEETWYGTNAHGTVVYHYGLVASHADYGTMAGQARPSVSSIHWTLR